MPTINYSLSKLRDRITGKSELFIALTFGNGKRVRGKSNIFIDPDRWDAKEQRLILPNVASVNRQEILRQQKRIIDLSEFIIEQFCNADKSAIDKKWIEETIDRFHFPEKYATKANNGSIIALFKDFMEQHRMSEWRRKSFAVIYRLLRRFEVYNDTTILISDFDTEYIRAIEIFIRNEYIFAQEPDYFHVLEAVPESRQINKRGENGIIEILNRLRTFSRWALDRGLLQSNPFHGYKIGQPLYGKPYYISLDERDKIYHCDLSSRPALAIQRDIFVFQCCIGCRVGDFFSMTKNDIIEGAIEYIPQKTFDQRGDVIRVPLNSIAIEIYERYADRDDDRLLPFISEQKYNDAIKEIFRIAEVTRPVTIINPLTRKAEKHPICDIASSHLARRTFIGNMYKKVKDLNLVCSLSGHVPGSKAVARYYEVDEEMRRDLVAMLE